MAERHKAASTRNAAATTRHSRNQIHVPSSCAPSIQFTVNIGEPCSSRTAIPLGSSSTTCRPDGACSEGWKPRTRNRFSMGGMDQTCRTPCTARSPTITEACSQLPSVS
jgi:hypothetical protein